MIGDQLSQVNKIAKRKSARMDIAGEGWSTTYLQHRRKYHRGTTTVLHAIVAEDVTVPMIVVLDVQLDLLLSTFGKKQNSLIFLKMRFSVRTSQHSDHPLKSARFVNSLSVVKVLNSSMKNAITQWEFWRKDIREGLDLVDGFFDEVSQFDPMKRTFSACHPVHQ